MQLGGPPGNCCARLVTFSFKKMWDGIFTVSFEDPEFDRENGNKPGDGKPLSQADQQKIMKDFVDNPDNWTPDPNGDPNTFKRFATFCDGSGEIDHFGI